MLDPARCRLSNGLRVIVVPLPHLHSVAMSMSVRSGSRHEQPATNGLSHLVEHLLFRGTLDHPSSFAFNAAVESLGGEVNGLTQRDATTIHMTFPTRTAYAGLELLGELCTRPLLGGLDIERGVVIEEILDTTDGAGNELDTDSLSRAVLWRDHPIGMPVAGTVDNVERFVEADCHAHYRRTFVAANGVLCIAGPVDVARAVAIAERAFGALPTGVRLAEGPAPTPQGDAPIHVQDNDDSQIGMLLTFDAPHENDPDFTSMLMLRRVLDDGLASRLRQDISESRGLAYSVSASIDVYSDIGAFDLDAAVSPGKLVTTFHQMLCTLNTLIEGGVGDAELERVKVRHTAELEFTLDDPGEICSWFGGAELVGCRAGYADRQREAMAVTSEDLVRVAKRVFVKDRAVVTLVGPLDCAIVADLERMIGREIGSALWFEADEAEAEADDAATESPLLAAG